MSFNISLRGLDSLERSLDRMTDQINQNVSRVIQRSVTRGVVDIQRSFRTPKTGREYRVPGTRTSYRASAVGETPAVVTGNLRNNIGFEFGGFTGIIFSRADYSQELEFDRPFMKPWFDDNESRVRSEIITAINGGIQSA